MGRPIALKACPRCRGDLMLEPEEEGPGAFVCLQCGRRSPANMALGWRKKQTLAVPAPVTFDRRPLVILKR